MLATLLASLTLAAAPPAGAASSPRPEITVVVESEARPVLDSGMLTEIAAGVHDIWRPYIDVTVISEPTSNPTTFIARSQLDGALRLILTDRTLRRGDVGSLGWIDFVGGRPSRTITISVTAAQALMEAARWKDAPLLTLPLRVRRLFLVRLVSRAIAHELGHYLLRSREHSRRGLMRDHVSADEMMRTRRVNHRLEGSDLERLKRRLVEYAQFRQWETPPA